MPLREERKTRRPNEGELLARYALHSIRPSWPNVAQEVTTAVLELKQETRNTSSRKIVDFEVLLLICCQLQTLLRNHGFFDVTHKTRWRQYLTESYGAFLVAAFVLHCNCGEKRPGKACQDLLQRSHESLRCTTTAKFAIGCNWWNIVLIVTLRNV